MKQLYDAVVLPIAERRTKGGWYRQWRLVSLDGSTLDVADTAENEKAFGRPCATDELTLAESVIPALSQGMLCLADRLFPSYKLWRRAAKTGADLLWRVRGNARLDVERHLPDGSCLSRIYASTSDRRNRRNGITVRVIDYRLEDVEGAGPVYRLITTILDHTLAPARELAALYHEGWEIETALDELKTHLRGAQIVLRSKTPELALFPLSTRKSCTKRSSTKMSNYNLRPRKRLPARRLDVSKLIRIIK